eukprot:Gb_37866 [translate_table: standard]
MAMQRRSDHCSLRDLRKPVMDLAVCSQHLRVFPNSVATASTARADLHKMAFDGFQQGNKALNGLVQHELTTGLCSSHSSSNGLQMALVIMYGHQQSLQQTHTTFLCKFEQPNGLAHNSCSQTSLNRPATPSNSPIAFSIG